MRSVFPAEDPESGIGRPKKSFLSKSQLRAAGTLLAALPSSECSNLSTRTHFVFHAQWARKENTLSLLTKHRQLAKSFSLPIRALWAACSRRGRELQDALLWSSNEGSRPRHGTGQPKEQLEVAQRSLSHLYCLETGETKVHSVGVFWLSGEIVVGINPTYWYTSWSHFAVMDPRHDMLFLIFIKRGIHERGSALSQTHWSPHCSTVHHSFKGWGWNHGFNKSEDNSMVKWVMILPATEVFSHAKAVIKMKMWQ